MSAPNGEFGRIGLIGLGLTGRGIVACLLAHGFAVTAYDRAAGARRQCRAHVAAALEEMVRRRLARRARIRDWRERLGLPGSPAPIGECGFVIESVTEDLAVKRATFDCLEELVPAGAAIASNTSGLPITLLQQGRRHPERLVGMHWGEPAQITRYLEIVPGRQTARETVARARRLGVLCGKEPAVLNCDISGFVSNRMMYAMIREACYLVEAGVADLETVDRSFRNDIGWWATLAGPFRWMDLTGIPAYAAVMEGLLPELSEMKSVPAVVKEAVRRGAQGTANAKGFYRYTRAGARDWERAWVDFTYDVRKLAEKYERRLKQPERLRRPAL